MPRYFRKTPKFPITGSVTSDGNNYDLNKIYSIKECIPRGWDHLYGMSDDEIIERLEDNGIGISNPVTLAAACQQVYDNNPNFDDAMDAIDVGWGNGVGIMPLALFDWYEQQEIFEDWYNRNVV